MCKNIVDQDRLVASCSFHCEFSSFLKLAVGCAKMGLKMDPILLNWIHPVLGFNCVLEFPHPVNNCVGNVGHIYMGVQVSIKFPIF